MRKFRSFLPSRRHAESRRKSALILGALLFSLLGYQNCGQFGAGAFGGSGSESSWSFPTVDEMRWVQIGTPQAKLVSAYQSPPNSEKLTLKPIVRAGGAIVGFIPGKYGPVLFVSDAALKGARPIFFTPERLETAYQRPFVVAGRVVAQIVNYTTGKYEVHVFDPASGTSARAMEMDAPTGAFMDVWDEQAMLYERKGDDGYVTAFYRFAPSNPTSVAKSEVGKAVGYTSGNPFLFNSRTGKAYGLFESPSTASIDEVDLASGAAKTLVPNFRSGTQIYSMAWAKKTFGAYYDVSNGYKTFMFEVDAETGAVSSEETSGMVGFSDPFPTGPRYGSFGWAGAGGLTIVSREIGRVQVPPESTQGFDAFAVSRDRSRVCLFARSTLKLRILETSSRNVLADVDLASYLRAPEDRSFAKIDACHVIDGNKAFLLPVAGPAFNEKAYLVRVDLAAKSKIVKDLGSVKTSFTSSPLATGPGAVFLKAGRGILSLDPSTLEIREESVPLYDPNDPYDMYATDDYSAAALNDAGQMWIRYPPAAGNSYRSMAYFLYKVGVLDFSTGRMRTLEAEGEPVRMTQLPQISAVSDADTVIVADRAPNVSGSLMGVRETRYSRRGLGASDPATSVPETPEDLYWGLGAYRKESGGFQSYAVAPDKTIVMNKASGAFKVFAFPDRDKAPFWEHLCALGSDSDKFFMGGQICSWSSGKCEFFAKLNGYQGDQVCLPKKDGFFNYETAVGGAKRSTFYSWSKDGGVRTRALDFYVSLVNDERTVAFGSSGSQSWLVDLDADFATYSIPEAAGNVSALALFGRNLLYSAYVSGKPVYRRVEYGATAPVDVVFPDGTGPYGTAYNRGGRIAAVSFSKPRRFALLNWMTGQVAFDWTSEWWGTPFVNRANTHLLLPTDKGRVLVDLRDFSSKLFSGWSVGAYGDKCKDNGDSARLFCTTSDKRSSQLIEVNLTTGARRELMTAKAPTRFYQLEPGKSRSVWFTLDYSGGDSNVPLNGALYRIDLAD